ncbi:signal recognition particle-docking protein FtsY [Candidatus Woesearchaeota archaeon]|nr:signal recognition particle-docking protein FtsY [Candidatus Woesearchaeota archaeon]
MFKFFKEKLKSAISKISEGVEKEGKIETLEQISAPPSAEEIIEKPVQEPKEEKGFFAKIKETFTGKKEVEEEKPKDVKIDQEALKKTILDPNVGGKSFGEFLQKTERTIENKKFEEKEQRKFDQTYGNYLKKEKPKKIETQIKSEAKKPEEKIQHKVGFFESIKEKITTTKIDEAQFEKLFRDLEMALMENNVALEVIEKIKNDLKEQLVEKSIKRTKVEETIIITLKSSIEGLFQNNNIDLIQEIRNKMEKPYIIAFFGINGSGKTTSIAKLAKMLKDMKISCVMAASDTFRAASIEQLQHHADKIGVKLIKHDYGADPAAVAFDAINHAKAKNIDVVLIDTAGRMHSNTNLIDELKKITRVAKPDLKIFVGESIAGNDCVNQATEFNEAVGIDGIILATDIDEKGGSAISVSYVTKKPILYLGTGQKYSDLQVFNSEVVIKNLGLV